MALQECKQFQQQKEQCLSSVDWSRKGSVDAPIVDLVQFINTQADYFTTSSCSGRVILVDNTDEHGEVQKQGCLWLYVTHEDVCCDSVKTKLHSTEGAAVFKFEPMVMHIQVRTLELAQRLHATAVASGFRNSGISIGKKGKIIVAIRSTHSLEVPLSSDGEILVSDAYIGHLVSCANKKMQENLGRISRFFTNFKSMVDNPEKKEPSEKGTKDRFHHKTPADQTALPKTQNCKPIEECFDSLLFEETT